MRAAIDWTQVRNRLEASGLALEAALSENAERIRVVYRQRARRLAGADANRKPVSPGLPALRFRLGRERYAIELAELAEVLPYRGCIPVPGASPLFRGVINLRGDLRAVIDLGRAIAAGPSADSGFILLLRRQMGLLVDEIEDLAEIRPEELSQPVPGRYLRGLGPANLMLLDAGALLSAVLSQKES